MLLVQSLEWGAWYGYNLMINNYFSDLSRGLARP